MFCNIGLQATTTEIPSYMICQSYWKMYHWQAEHKCGAFMMVLRHILAELCEMFSVTPNMTDGNVKQDLLHGLHARQIWILWRQLKTIVYAAPVDSKQALQHRTVDGCQTIRNFQWMRCYIMRCVEAFIESHGGHFEHLYKCTLSSIAHKRNISGYMFTRTFLLVLVMEFALNVCPYPPVTPCICTDRENLKNKTLLSLLV
jgi:hypothetical protein